MMGKLMVVVDDELEKEFRATVAKIYGARKGTLSMAVEEAIMMWIDKHMHNDEPGVASEHSVKI